MTKRDRLTLIIVLSAIAVVGFWFLIIGPQRKAATAAEGELVTAREALDAAQQKLNAGRQAQQAFRRDRTTIVKLGRVVPETDDIPTLLTQLEALAKKEKVEFRSYQVDSSGGQSSTAQGAAATTTDTTTTVGGQTGTRSTDTVAPLYSPGSVEVDGGLGRTPITIELKGKYFQLERYLRSVQRFAVLSAKRTTSTGRLVIVDGFSYAGATEEQVAVAEGTQDASGTETKTTKKTKVSRSPNLLATLSASVYYAPPLETPSASAAGAVPPADPAAAASTSTGAATVGALR